MNAIRSSCAPSPRRSSQDTFIGLILWVALWFGAAGGLVASPGEALRAYQGGQLPEARKEYERLAKEHPDDPRYRFNAGDVAYRQKDWTNAVAWFESVLANPDVDLQQQANYNLGNTRFRLGESAQDPQERMKEWEQSIGHFEAATRLNPTDSNAVNNLSFARQRLEDLKRQQPPPPKQGNKNDQKKQPPKDSKDQAGNDSKQDNQKQDGKKKDQQDQPPSPGDESQKGQNSQQQPKPEVAQDSKDGSKPDQKSQGQPKGDGKDGQDPEAGEASAPQPTPEKKPGDKAGQASQGAAEKPGEPDEAENAKPGEMSMIQAQRLLDSQKGDEKALVFHSRGTGKESRDDRRPNRRPW